jgi:polyisoprenoid-binding protein YceI
MTIATHPSFATGTWKLDLAHSELSFSIRHLAISKVRGTFAEFDVTVVTGESLAESSIEANIDIASVNTNQKDRDNHLRTSDFFLVEEFPTATFKSTSISVDGDDFTVVGDFTLRGVTKSIELAGELGGVTVDGYGQTKAGATVTTKINRLDFGVNWNAAIEAGGFTLGDQVTISAEIAVVLQP